MRGGTRARRVAAMRAVSAYTASEVSSKLPTPPKLPNPTAPLSPRTHRLSMSAVSMQRLKVSPCKEHHREFWLPSRSDALRDPLHPSVMQGHRDFRTKDFVWSRPPTDYRASNWYIENHWALHSMRKSESEPSKVKQPWTSSAQFQSCCVGGVGGGRKGRNKGSYEDDFAGELRGLSMGSLLYAWTAELPERPAKPIISKSSGEPPLPVRLTIPKIEARHTESSFAHRQCPVKTCEIDAAWHGSSSSSSSSAFLGAVAVGAAAGALAGVGLTLALRRPAAPRPRPGIKASAQVADKLKQALVVPVVAMQDASGAPALAAALMEGGLTAIEVVFRTAAAEEALRRMAAAEPSALVGAGTVLSAEQAKRAVSAGAQFIVSPGLNPEVVNWCLENGVAVIPGVATPTEVESAMRMGLSVLKFFPAEANGGVNTLKAISAPYGQITWMPTGGISEDNLEKYLMMPQVACCGGSWMVPQDAVAQGNWRYVKELSQRARQLAQSIALKKRK
ncbi:eda [Symbiodinium natans]|uniref:Eda protein n=1 Tax=Symbiodinium natans TaxID=878477 RepID=A0A812U5E5_9DINO|nr:eda [Symbiodinium natans]